MIRLIAALLLIACTRCMALSSETTDAAAVASDVKPVDFAHDVMPLLRRSCVACHHAKEAEGGLVLESFESLMKGGDSGPGVVAKESGNSPLWNRASGAEEPIMPPEDNTVGAKPLAAGELELIKRWIDQGAAPSVEKKPLPIQWETPASTLQPAYAVATSGDGRFAAAGRGNQVTVYDHATGAELAKLVDPSLKIKTPATDLDLVQSIAFSPDG
ncbi:MAG: c-type cytochrome domain-containing protein, partial [Planctomycetaceae bacterium]